MRNFGVEIEMVGLPMDRVVAVLTAAGITCQNSGYTHSVTRYWKVVRDGSVPTGCEVVSPILSGEDGLRELRQVMTALDDAGAGVNRLCGLHVHIDASGLTASDIANVVRRYARHEDEIDAFMPRSRRANNNNYCMSVRGLTIDDSSMDNLVRSGGGRYRKVNLQSYIRYGTVEFRQHSGTLNATKAVNWVLFLQAFVEESRTRETGGTIVQHLSRSMRETVDLITDVDLSADSIANATGVTRSTAMANISDLRRAGYVIQRRRGYDRTFRYRITGHRGAPAQATDRGLWAGVPANIQQFYATRRAALAGE